MHREIVQAQKDAEASQRWILPLQGAAFVGGVLLLFTIIFGVSIPVEFTVHNPEWSTTESSNIELLPVESGTLFVQETQPDGSVTVSGIDLDGMTYLVDVDARTAVWEEQECVTSRRGETILYQLLWDDSDDISTTDMYAKLYDSEQSCGQRTVIISPVPFDFISLTVGE